MQNSPFESSWKSPGPKVPIYLVRNIAQYAADIGQTTEYYRLSQNDLHLVASVERKGELGRLGHSHVIVENHGGAILNAGGAKLQAAPKSRIRTITHTRVR